MSKWIDKMKKFKNKLIAVLLVLVIVFILYKLIFPIVIYTDDYTAALYWDGAYLTDYKGKEKDVQIPNYIGIFPVVFIGGDCFEYTDTIETVVIPNNVREIGEGAFSDCLYLKSVEASNIKIVGEGAFARTPRLERVELGGELRTIGEGAFNGAHRLEKVDLGGKLQTIGRAAFAECYALTYIPSRSSLKEIGSYAFYGCEIEDPGDLTGITVGDDAFLDCPWSKSPRNPSSINNSNSEESSE